MYVVELVDLPHLTNHSDTLVGVQIDNWGGGGGGGEKQEPQCCGTCGRGRSEGCTQYWLYSMRIWKRVHVSHIYNIIQYVHVTVCSMLGIKI